VRPDSARLAEWQVRFGALGAAIDTTPWTAEAMIPRLAALAPTHVFALLGTTRARAQAAAARGERADYEAIDYGLTMLLLRAARAVVPAPRFVYLSSAGVREGTRNPYLAVRARVERELVASGMHYIVAQPAFITGEDREEDRPAERWGARLGDAALAVVARLGAPSLAARWGSITGGSLARGLVRVALDPGVRSTMLTTESLRG
jgi:uncharacterized protein YbjT (DUF2867 family)